jgi:hypothetical protein
MTPTPKMISLNHWRKADLDARDAELTLRLSVLKWESGDSADVPSAIIEAASRLREAACVILKALLLPQPARGGRSAITGP